MLPHETYSSGRRPALLAAIVAATLFTSGVAQANSYAVIVNHTPASIDVTVEYKNSGEGGTQSVTKIPIGVGTSKALWIDCKDKKPASALKVTVRNGPNKGSTGWVEGFDLNGYSGVILEVTANSFVNFVAPSGPATKSAPLR